jgi:hypothetical protein
VVIAIFHLIFGGLALLGMICGGVLIAASVSMMANMPKPAGQPAPPDPFEEYKYLNDHLPGYYAYLGGTGVIAVVASIVLVVAGIGLLKMRPWARVASIVYGVAEIVIGLGSLVYNLVFVAPLSVDYQAEVSKRTPGAPSLGSGWTYGMTIVAFLIGAAYPVAVLICMYLPRVRAAFARAAHPQGEVDERYAEEADDRPDILDRPADREERIRPPEEGES